MFLFFVRHSKAEQRKTGQLDKERALSDLGREIFAANLPLLKSQVDSCSINPCQMQVWSSPAIRARQTAELLCQTLNFPAERIIYRDFIYEQTDEGLDYALQEARLDQDACLFVVGHQPSLGIWATRLYGDYIEFRAGDIVGFELTSWQPLRGEKIFP